MKSELIEILFYMVLLTFIDASSLIMTSSNFQTGQLENPGVLNSAIMRTKLLYSLTYAIKVITVHSRGAAATTIGMLATMLKGILNKAILHGFTGSLQEAKLAIDAGFYFSN